MIENIQRDVNVAFMNEVAIIFEKLNLDTNEVLDAAKTKWNFIDFRPGLVGGHCIGVDPYYLTYRAEQIGIYSQIVHSARRVNDSVAEHITFILIKKMIQKNKTILRSKVLVMGLTFKENCPDIRNSKVFDLIRQIEAFGISVYWFDPWVDQHGMGDDFEAKRLKKLPKNYFDAILLSVAHQCFIDLGVEKIRSSAKSLSVIGDIKAMFSKSEVDFRL